MPGDNSNLIITSELVLEPYVQLIDQCRNGVQEACQELQDMCDAGDLEACEVMQTFAQANDCNFLNIVMSPDVHEYVELRQACLDGDELACKVLSTEQLGIACRAGNNTLNAACEELLRRCNAGDTVACLERRTCSDAIYDYLANRPYDPNDSNSIPSQEVACGYVMTCRLAELTCSDFSQRMTNISLCISARQAIVEQCFQGIPDNRHINHLENYPPVYNRCLNRWNAGNCSENGDTPPTLQPVSPLNP